MCPTPRPQLEEPQGCQFLPTLQAMGALEPAPQAYTAALVLLA